MKRLAVLTSGGDAPGMNAALRAVVRVGVANGFEVFGVHHGYHGLIQGTFKALGARDVGGIMERGGTVLGTARCAAMFTEDGQDQALFQLRQRDIDRLIVIGGEGSQTGAHALARKGLAVVGVASTIDNDLLGSDITIGATTAIDVALESVDRLRVTASSLGRVFLVEVMGRESGYIAANVGIACGAEVVVVPESPVDPEDVASEILAAYERGKSHAIAIVAEGARHNAEALADYFAKHHARLGFDLRVCRLGHVQRGGAPGVIDRMLATRLGAAAVAQIDAGPTGVLVGSVAGAIVATALNDVAGRKKGLDPALLELARVLAQ
ncbi:ATP-dependent 6-phosphofructokinase [Rhizobacter sp. Root404]|jgi:6-phosphofructokinase 1|uniref:ATP-dependent 6-phosphofructokinase n=1 Tax=Rhizobacter sp. Root404 TaxID=1736528 RepID=UPI0006FB815C|nr:ATP-dependent 6-phosphofructokinase [Rhizobacter sp. Root404]KQW37662.1 6-phosphofructokinase [Rhizobacter sp. Root404]